MVCAITLHPIEYTMAFYKNISSSLFYYRSMEVAANSDSCHRYLANRD